MGALTDAANLAADALVERAIAGGARMTWLGATVEANGDAVLRTGDATLYDGSAGIALAAWSVARALAREDLAEVAVAAARHAVSVPVPGIGLFDGLAGIGLAAHTVGLPEGRDILTRVAAAPLGALDLISGSAGAILALLAAGDADGALRHGDHLLAKADRHPWGWSWDTGLCGLAHGAAGAAWALGALAAQTGEARFAEAAVQARRYERAWFQPAQNSWPDLRADAMEAAARAAAPPAGSAAAPPGASPALLCPALWCHGATGVGLSRLALHRLHPAPALEAEAACALQAATAAASRELRHGADLTVCHGLGGTLLLLLEAARALGEQEHQEAARWIAERALEWLGDDAGAWPSGVPGGGFSPGLMTGLAGTMHVLARLEHDDVPGLPALST